MDGVSSDILPCHQSISGADTALIQGPAQVGIDPYVLFTVPLNRGIKKPAVGGFWWDYLGSNRRPLRCERSALTN